MSTALPLHGVVRGACHHDCPDTCLWEVTVEDGRAIRLVGADDHPTTAGALCPKVNRFLDRVHDPDRLTTPLRRAGPKGSGAFVPVTWQEAIAEIADRVTSVAPARVLQYSFDGTQGLVQKGVVADRFFARLGAADIHRDLCGTTASMAAADVLGQPFGIDPEDLVHARTILLWGTNTLHTNRHLWPTIQTARAAGAHVVVIDPVRTPTAVAADQHVRLRPGTDVALVLGMIHVMDRDGLLDAAWLRDHTTEWEELRASAAAMPPDVAGATCGIDADVVTDLATRFATVQPAAVRTLIGMEHQQRGREMLRAVTMLPCVTGAWRQRGGGLARSTQIWFETALGLAPPPGSDERPRHNMARLGEVLCNEEPDGVAVLVVHNSNPAVTVPDTNRVLAGLARDDLCTVVIEQFMTDTARYADLVLPTTTQVEHLDLAIAWGHRHLALNLPAAAAPGECLPNSEIFRRLAAACGMDDPVFAMTDEELVRDLLDVEHPWLDGISFERLREDGWATLRVSEGWRPHVDGTPTMFRLGALDPDVPDVPTNATGQPRLRLHSRKQAVKFLNSHYGGFDAHLPKGGEPTLAMHPDDMGTRGLAPGDLVRVANERGHLDLVVTMDLDLQPGLVTCPFGYWHRAPDARAGRRGGTGVNTLTNPVVADDDRGTPFFHDTFVDVLLLTPKDP